LALLLSFFATPAADARQSLSAFFGPICIWVSDLGANSTFETRDDLAARVSSAVQIKVEEAERITKRKVWAAPNCIKPDQPGFDHQLTLELSIKRQKIKLDGRDQNVVVASGVSTNGLIAERSVQPVIIIRQESVADDEVVGALVEFVDRTVVKALRRQ
jgi:hypothetical protein